MRRSRPSQSQRQRRGEFRFTLLCSAPNRNGQSRTSTATARGQWAVRRSTSQPVGQASAKFNPMWLRNSPTMASQECPAEEVSGLSLQRELQASGSQENPHPGSWEQHDGP
ncbi:unnamed protein product [Durusdinium trenchii]|uniref:Uncharacterized protein n=1 Tax=Durusdinium trenchii TaxID=1381693 RepID=A0ABP0KE61_9DINO